jgi:hypothetical protein
VRIYTVACVEAPMPPQPFEPVRVAASGPVDAMLRAGPLFSAEFQDRPRQVFARLEVIGVEPPGPMRPAWSFRELVQLIDDEGTE